MTWNKKGTLLDIPDMATTEILDKVIDSYHKNNRGFGSVLFVCTKFYLELRYKYKIPICKASYIMRYKGIPVIHDESILRDNITAIAAPENYIKPIADEKYFVSGNIKFN